jgi:hypothetical protein
MSNVLRERGKINWLKRGYVIKHFFDKNEFQRE